MNCNVCTRKFKFVIWYRTMIENVVDRVNLYLVKISSYALYTPNLQYLWFVLVQEFMLQRWFLDKSIDTKNLFSSPCQNLFNESYYEFMI